MKQIVTFIASVIVMLGGIQTSLGQPPLPAQNLQVHLKVAPATSQLLREVPPDSVSAVLATLPLQCTYVITLADTTGLDSVSVKLGSTSGGNQFYQGTLPAHGSGTLASGESYTREGKTLKVQLGQFQGLSQFHAEVRTVSSANGPSGPLRKAGP